MHLQKYFCPCSHTILSKQGAKKSRPGYLPPAPLQMLFHSFHLPMHQDEELPCQEWATRGFRSMGDRAKRMLHPVIILQRRGQDTCAVCAQATAASTYLSGQIYPHKFCVCWVLPAPSASLGRGAAAISSCLQDFRSHRVLSGHSIVFS